MIPRLFAFTAHLCLGLLTSACSSEPSQLPAEEVVQTGCENDDECAGGYCIEGLPNGLKVGFAEAFRRTHKPIACHGCFCIATVESDLLFGLDSDAITNTLGYLAGEKLRAIQRRF